MTLEKPPGIDWFNLLFFRVQQIAGLAIVIYEVVLRTHAQFSVLLFASAMMLGPTGLKLILRGTAAVATVIREADDE